MYDKCSIKPLPTFFQPFIFMIDNLLTPNAICKKPTDGNSKNRIDIINKRRKASYNTQKAII